MSDDYCELCDLPRSTCIHGRPPAPPPPPAPRATTPRKPRTTSRTATRASSSTATTPPVRRAPRRWTPPEELRPHIVGVLRDAGGELDADAVFDRLAGRLEGVLIEGDHGTTPEGEPRWRYAARRARQGLIAEGVMVKGRPGVWELSESGRLAD